MSIKSKKDYLIWGINTNSNKIGACGLKKITKLDCEYWGYIGEKEYWGKGIGKTMMNLVEEKARDLKLKSIWLKVLVNNERAINLYHKCDYIIEKEQGQIFLMRKIL